MKVMVEQNSPQWLEMRKNKLGASEVSAVLEVSQFIPRNLKQLVEIKKGVRTVFYNQAMRAGHDNEARARELAEEKLKTMFEPQTYILNNLIASLDGISFDGSTLIEIKTSKKNIGELVEQYYYQIQQQLWLSDATFAYLVAYRVDSDEIEVSGPIGKDLDAWQKILQAEKDFIKAMAEYEPQEIDDLATQYHHLAMQKAEIESKMQVLKELLIEKHEDGYKDELVSLYKVAGRKTVDYKAMVTELLPDVDLEKYTKVGADSYAIKVL